MREEYIKNSFEINGTTVYESSDEFIFTSENSAGENSEHHIAKKDPFPINEKQSAPLRSVLEASVAFPNLPISKALEEFAKVKKVNHKK